MNFKSNAEEIRYYMKQLLDKGGEHTVDEIKQYVHDKTEKDFTNGTYAGAMRDLIDRDPNYHIPRRGIYASKTLNTSSYNFDIFDDIINQALSSIDEACKIDITKLTVSQIEEIQKRSIQIKDTLKSLLTI